VGSGKPQRDGRHAIPLQSAHFPQSGMIDVSTPTLESHVR
jgi:hypothetical protein